MEANQNDSLFSELTPEEAAAVNGAHYRHRRSYRGTSYRYYYPRRRHYEVEYSRRHNYHHYRGTTISISAVIGF